MDDQGSGIRSIEALGKILNQRYQLTRQIGHGAMGDVYCAHDLRLDRDVAVKVLRETLTGDPILRARFEREAKAAGKLSHHPNVVTVFDVDETHNQPFIVMELVTGGTLSSRIRSGPIPLEESIHITNQILSALSFAHDHGIIHRDIKPSNIFISKDDEIKVGDFGIATIYEGSGDSNLTLTSQIIGTPAYLSPERAEGKTGSASSDIFSVGVVLYEMLTGQKPFPNTSPIATMIAAKQGEFVGPEILNPSIPEHISQVIKRSLSANPDLRYSSAQHMATALIYQGKMDDTAPINKADSLTCDKTVAMAPVPFTNPYDDTSSMTTTAGSDVMHAVKPYSKTFGSKITIILAAIFSLIEVLGHWIYSKLPAGLRERFNRRSREFGLLAVALAAFLLVTVLFFAHGGASNKSNPSTSKLTTTSTTVAPTTTMPPTTTTPTITTAPIPIGPPGHGKKGH